MDLSAKIGKALEKLPEKFIKDYRLYYDSIHIECLNEAASAKVVHSLIQETQVEKFRKEMTSKSNKYAWQYFGEIVIADNQYSWKRETFSIFVSPSYPNPACTPVKTIQKSEYASWRCEVNKE